MSLRATFDRTRCLVETHHETAVGHRPGAAPTRDFAGLLVDKARLINIAHVWLQRVAAAAEATASLDDAADASAAVARVNRNPS